MKKVLRKIGIIALVLLPALAEAGYVEGTISKVFVGRDNWYGVRLYLNVTNDQSSTSPACTLNSPAFVFTEPTGTTTATEHRNQVAVFLSAYLNDKSVGLTLEPGTGGNCKITEGFIQ